MTQSVSLLAFGFGNLAMLGWLAAAAAPLLIHLWSRHRFRETRWAAMQFLLAAMRKNARRMQLQQWLLLAVRTLLILCVVLAVAEPYGAGLVAGGASSAPTHKILVLDGSYSMAFREGGSTHFERAKQLAAELVRSSSAGDAFTVILMAEPARTILGREVVDAKSVATQIQSLPQACTAADLTAALALVSEALDRNADDSRGLGRQEVYFFTDLQRTTWQNPGSRAERGNEEDTDTERGNEWVALGKRAALVVVNVGMPRAANLAVTKLAADEPFVTVGREISLAATLRQYGDQPRDQCVVELSVDDVPVGEQTVDVPAGGEAAVHFSHRFDSPGSHAIAVRAEGDQLAIDNARWLAANVEEHVRVLCVAGREGAAKYIAQALNPDPADDAAIEPMIVSDGDLEELELTDFDCIFLCNVAQLTNSEAERLTRYAADGGGIVFFLGDRVVADRYNDLARGAWGRGPSKPPAPPRTEGLLSLDANRPANSLIPAHIGSVAASASVGVDPLDYRHPIIAPFRGRERAGLLTTPISRYYRLDTSQAAAGVEVAAALAGGDPLIVAAPSGRGRTVVVATDGSLSSIDPATGEPWTNWPTWPSFLPIVREVLAYASGGRHDQWQQQVGTPLGGALSSPDGASAYSQLQMVRPDGRTDPVGLHSVPDGWEWRYDKTNENGVYTLRGAPTGTMNQFAVNVVAVEGNLAKADADALPPDLVVRNTWQTVDRVSAAGLAPRSAWDRTLLWSALGLMLFESLLAWQFGRGAA